MNDVRHIVVTGGPCGGKSTMVERLLVDLPHHGIEPLVVPEIATLLMASGAHPDATRPAYNYHWQKTYVSLYLDFYRRMDRFAAEWEGPVAVIYDRGPFDAHAYMPEDEFKKILHRLGWSRSELLMGMYDAVVHLTSVALDRPELWERLKRNNCHRLEASREQAMAADDAVRLAWIDHPSFWEVPNNGSFEDKARRTIDIIKWTFGA